VRCAVLLPAALVVSLLNNLKASWAVLAFIAVLYGPILWLTVLLHELGHCLATKRVRSYPSSAYALSAHGVGTCTTREAWGEGRRRSPVGWQSLGRHAAR